MRPGRTHVPELQQLLPYFLLRSLPPTLAIACGMETWDFPSLCKDMGRSGFLVVKKAFEPFNAQYAIESQ